MGKRSTIRILMLFCPT
jgi:hypothetical protein